MPFCTLTVMLPVLFAQGICVAMACAKRLFGACGIVMVVEPVQPLASVMETSYKPAPKKPPPTPPEKGRRTVLVAVVLVPFVPLPDQLRV